MLCYVMLCYVMLWYTILYYTILYYTILYYTMCIFDSGSEPHARKPLEPQRAEAEVAAAQGLLVGLPRLRHIIVFKCYVYVCAALFVVQGFDASLRGGEGTADWDAVAPNCSTENCLPNLNKRISSKNSNFIIWARWGFPTASSPPSEHHPRLPTGCWSA